MRHEPAILSMSGKSRRLRTWAGRAGVVVWGLVTLLVSSALMVGHLLTLPKPASEVLLIQRLQADAARERRPGTRYVLHVLAESCRCSQRILEHLLARGAEPSMTEKVLLIGGEGRHGEQLRARGFGFERVTAEQLEARYGIEGVPLLLVLGPSGRLEYLGGYSQRRQGAPEDAGIFHALVAGERVQALPLFGCAVSRALQRELDPFALKYPQEPETSP